MKGKIIKIKVNGRNIDTIIEDIYQSVKGKNNEIWGDKFNALLVVMPDGTKYTMAHQNFSGGNCGCCCIVDKDQVPAEAYAWMEL